MLKKEARKFYREKRDALTVAERIKLNDLLLIQFQSADLPLLHQVLSYNPIEENKEPDTHLFTGYLKFIFPELQLLYPRSDFINYEMKAISVNEETAYEKTEYNIYEPEDGLVIPADEIDMVIVPLLAFDRNGYRVGYGKGFYDKFLSGCRADCVKAGFSYFEPVDLLEDYNEFDLPLSLCITPLNTYVF